MSEYEKFESLLGKTLTSVKNVDDEQLIFTVDDGSVYSLSHYQDCFESVSIESITGDLQDLIGSPILRVEESCSDKWPEGLDHPEYTPESFTWTFYKLATRKGYVDVRWFGQSNGYYSESVYFGRVEE